MERLTTKNIAGVAVYKHPFECERCGETIWRLPDYGDGSPTEKLADYEDAEEQGLLLRLPCKVGDIVYRIINQRDNYDDTVYQIVSSTIFELSMINKIGKTVFLTQTEAEQKLKEMESESE